MKGWHHIAGDILEVELFGEKVPAWTLYWLIELLRRPARYETWKAANQ